MSIVVLFLNIKMLILTLCGLLKLYLFAYRYEGLAPLRVLKAIELVLLVITNGANHLECPSIKAENKTICFDIENVKKSFKEFDYLSNQVVGMQF